MGVLGLEAQVQVAVPGRDAQGLKAHHKYTKHYPKRLN